MINFTPLEINMKKSINILLAGFASLSVMNFAYAASTQAEDAYRVEKNSATESYKVARAKCDLISGNPKDVCIEEAKAAEVRSKSNAEAKYKNTPKAYTDARISIADADFSVAKEKCNAKTADEKKICIEEAKAVHTKTLVDAKSGKEIQDVKKEATEDKLDADYKVDVEKCERLGGSMKDACVAAAKAKYGK
jgi:hypothetical protein